MRIIQTIPIRKTKYNKEGITINIAELKKISDYVLENVDMTKISSLNKSMTKKQSYEILIGNFLGNPEYKKLGNLSFSPNLSPLDTQPLHDDNELQHIHFSNIVREFILQQKTFTERWKKIKCIKETQDYREEKLNDLL